MVPLIQNLFSPFTLPIAQGTCGSACLTFSHVNSFTTLVRRSVDINEPVDISKGRWAIYI